MRDDTDRGYLRNAQYRDARNVNARIDLHTRFSENRYGWQPWIFDHLPTAAACRVLEVGCGPGRLWLDNAARIPGQWSIVLSDFSTGMLEDTRRTLVLDRPMSLLVCDAQALPFRDATFDCVVANHMLFHVPDRARAVDEIVRVLMPEGCLLASTVGDAHLVEIDEWLDGLGVPAEFRGAAASARFTLENGARQLSATFASVERDRYVDALRVTEAEPLLAFIASMRAGAHLSPAALAQLRVRIDAELCATGAVRITKDSGVFVARGPRRSCSVVQ
jgi:SAM-dependent methyltransferase